jgi:membrane peptidoglycan carboxypeptidase
MTENSLANSTGEKSVLDTWRIFLCLSILIAIFGAGIGIRVIGSLPIPQPMNVDGQGLILDRRDIPIAELTPEKNYIPITLEQISPVAVDALMVAVDPNFLTSNYEFGELVRASWRDLQGSNGLSYLTLSQQYLRLVNGNDDLSSWRKLREATSILRIQRTLSKEEILERYINVIPFGRESFGVEAGAQAWFGVSASNLDVDQAVYLAALFLVARDYQNVELAEIHAGKILSDMLEQGHITKIYVYDF